MAYDSTEDTLKHISRVNALLGQFAIQLVTRGLAHDKSKLQSPEKELFDEMTPLLADLTYDPTPGSPYKQALEKLKPALDHHYAVNSHHPEFYENGVAGMDLLDLVEMFFDWKAATERHKDGDLITSIEKNGKRFDLPPMLVSIFKNTASSFKYA